MNDGKPTCGLYDVTSPQTSNFRLTISLHGPGGRWTLDQRSLQFRCLYCGSQDIDCKVIASAPGRTPQKEDEKVKPPHQGATTPGDDREGDESKLDGSV